MTKEKIICEEGNRQRESYAIIDENYEGVRNVLRDSGARTLYDDLGRQVGIFYKKGGVSFNVDSGGRGVEGFLKKREGSLDIYADKNRFGGDLSQGNVLSSVASCLKFYSEKFSGERRQSKLVLDEKERFGKLLKKSDDENRIVSLNYELFGEDSGMNDVDEKLRYAVRDRKIPDGMNSKEFETFYKEECFGRLFGGLEKVVDFNIAPKGEGEAGEIFGEYSGGKYVVSKIDTKREALIKMFAKSCVEIEKVGKGTESEYRFFEIPSGGVVAVTPWSKNSSYVVDDIERFRGNNVLDESLAGEAKTKVELMDDEVVVRKNFFGEVDSFYSNVMRGFKENYLEKVAHENMMRARDECDEEKVKVECIKRLYDLGENFLSVKQVQEIMGFGNVSTFKKIVDKYSEFFEESMIREDGGRGKFWFDSDIVEKMIDKGKFAGTNWNWTGLAN